MSRVNLQTFNEEGGKSSTAKKFRQLGGALCITTNYMHCKTSWMAGEKRLLQALITYGNQTFKKGLGLKKIQICSKIRFKQVKQVYNDQPLGMTA